MMFSYFTQTKINELCTRLDHFFILLTILTFLCVEDKLDIFLCVIFRWSQLRISLLPHLILFEPLSECMLMGVIASWAAEYIFGISSMGFFLMHVLVWFLFDYALLTSVEVGSDGFNTCSNIQSLL